MKYNRKAIMKRAWEIKREDDRNVFSICLKMAWAEAKEVKVNRMSGTTKQIEWATGLLDNMKAEFANCKELAPVEFHHVFDEITSILSNAYAGDVITILKGLKDHGQKYFGKLMISVNVSGCAAAMEIKRTVK